MIIQKFSVNQYTVQHILSLVQTGQIAIPEIQRPFVWDSTKVRDLIDSLYRGYPIGYIIVWQNPAVRLKDGSSSAGKKIIIDGQQRITALISSILGKEIIDTDYRKRKIAIAFNPIDKKFEVSNSFIQKDKKWIPDISKIFSPDFQIFLETKKYCNLNNNVNEDLILTTLSSLQSIVNIPIGLIELNPDLNIEEVTDIFIRMNSQGISLSQADFAMSKIAVDEKYGGQLIRKAIDYFCHLAIKPEFYTQLKENDKEFVQTEYFKKMTWLKDDRDDIYDPSYNDMIKVIFTSKFNRGRMTDLVALLSGRDFETKQYFEDIVKNTFEKLNDGILSFINETNFKNFVMIIRSAGFIDSSLLYSQNALNFAYILYLKLKEKGFKQYDIEHLVRKWFVLTVLTARYSSQPETNFEMDIKRVDSDPVNFINNEIKSKLSNSFWDISLVQDLDTSNVGNPIFCVYLASQVKMGDFGFLSDHIKVESLIKIKGDYHHIFPKDYLKKNGYPTRSQYNQVANYVVTQSEINLEIGNKAPKAYFNLCKEQCKTKQRKIGYLLDYDKLVENLNQHCIPLDIFNHLAENYEEFLKERRKLIAQKIKKYFEML